jgi:hypothetical protein
MDCPDRKPMKYLLVYLALFAGAVHGVAETATAASDQQVERMRQVLVKQGWKDYISEAHRQGWSCPFIPSQWHVEHVSTGDVWRAETAARAFGKELVNQLAVLPPKLRGPMRQEELYDQATHLLDLSAWCFGENGYGNVYLSHRCFELACIPLLRLVADLSVAPERYEPLLKRLKPAWLDPEVRRQLLNRDAGVEVLPVGTNTQAELSRLFRIGSKQLLDPAANLPFFLNDKPVAPWTLKAHWDRKWHWGIATLTLVQLADQILGLAEYRQVMKKFPTEYTNPSGKIVVGADAFHEAWYWEYIDKIPGRREGTARVDHKRLVLDAPAWSGYKKVQSGEILDQDSAEEKWYRDNEKPRPKSQELPPSP